MARFETGAGIGGMERASSGVRAGVDGHPVMVATAPQTQREAYASIPMTGLVAREPVPFPLFLRTANQTWVLYRPADTALDASHLGRLQAEGVAELFIREIDRDAYYARVERSLEELMHERGVAVERRAEVLQGVARKMAEDLFAARPDRAMVQRAQKVMMASCGFLLRETQGFQAIRRVLAASPGLAQHSLTVSFLSMGLARGALGGDATTVMMAGLAGLLHDVGKVGYEGIDHDPEHAGRGADYLRSVGVQAPVVEAARLHHERWDGSGYPGGLQGLQIPDLARVVGLADTFDKVYSSQQPRVGVFDALRILAQAYRGCFDDKLTAALVRLFR